MIVFFKCRGCCPALDLVNIDVPESILIGSAALMATTKVMNMNFALCVNVKIFVGSQPSKFHTKSLDSTQYIKSVVIV